MAIGAHLAAILILMTLAASGQPRPQEQSPAPATSGQTSTERPTFTMAVDYVEVDATILDAQGQPLQGLGTEDFQIFEDGRAQQVETVAFVDVPIDASPASGIPTDVSPSSPDVKTNVDPFDGRIYVLLMDDLHTAAARTQFARASARQFVDQHLRPGDLASVVHVSAPAANQDFTSDPRLLLASIDRFVGRKVRSSTLNQVDEHNRALTFGRAPVMAGDPDTATRGHNAATVFAAIASLAKQLSVVRSRRKALLWFSEGTDVETPQRTGGAPASASAAVTSEQADARRRASDALSLCSRTDLIVYGIDPRGLRGAGDELVQLGSVPTDPTVGLGPASLGHEAVREQSTLRSVSDVTGGFAIVNTGEISQAFDRIVTENSSYYVLGYNPTNSRRDGRFRRIEVRVARPGVQVRARRGYLAPSGPAEKAAPATLAGAPARLQEALQSPVPNAGLGMAVQSAVFRSGPAKASVLVTVQYAAAAFRRPLEPEEKLEISVVATDAGGGVRGSDHRTIEFDVSTKTRQTLQTLGFRTFSRLELPAGRYQLRVASVFGSTGQLGSVRSDLDVPDFPKNTPSLSSLLITSRLAALIPTAGVDERLNALLAAPPTTLRDFGIDDTLVIGAELYDDSPSARPLNAQAVILSSENHAVLKAVDMRRAESSGASRGASAYGASIPLAGLTPGAYLLRVGVTGEPAAAGITPRDVPFRVWGPSDSGSAGGLAPAPVVPVIAGAQSGVHAQETVVARTSSEWLALWGRLPVKRMAPHVTFDSTMAVAIFLGARPTAGYAVHVVGTRLEGDTLVVEFREQTPPDTADNPLVQTTPYVVAGIRRHDGPVRFQNVSTP